VRWFKSVNENISKARRESMADNEEPKLTVASLFKVYVNLSRKRNDILYLGGDSKSYGEISVVIEILRQILENCQVDVTISDEKRIRLIPLIMKYIPEIA
jgi:hypothetical protein